MMKKIGLFLALLLMVLSLAACKPAMRNTGSSVGNPTTGSAPRPGSDKKDEIVYLWYHYTDQYGNSSKYDGINLDTVDCSILLRIIRETTFTDEQRDETPPKMRFCIRYYPNGENDFFTDPNAQYIDLTQTATNKRADVKYWISYESESLVMEYTTPEGTVRRFAPLSQETIQELTEYFAEVEEALVNSGI